MLKRIGIVTGTRAEYGLLSRTIELLQSNSDFQTVVFTCGTHLAPEFGYTIQELSEHGVQNIEPVEMLLSSKSRAGVAKSVGLACISFADAFSRQDLDGVLLLGDRYEVLAAAQTAMFLEIPVVHIHGGEVTEGAFDDAIRHSITKMANIHFPVAEQFAERIKQLGESEDSVFVVGSPGVDNILNSPRMNQSELEQSLGFSLSKNLALVTYHPVTKASNSQENDIEPLVSAIRNNPNLQYVITFPNADGGGAQIIEQWKTIEHLNNVHIVPSLGFIRYLSIMEHVSCVIGNSSSGIIEAPSFNTVTLNIGTRQLGRPRAQSVIDLAMNEQVITEVLQKIANSEEIVNFEKNINPYGKGGTAELVVKLLSELDLPSYLNKSFRDI
ncbi:UDP-N-acetylglucosamine 2-epimerase [Pleionea sediminis]|uniref:UDP-N-acetylglucosamine 2-epimerase n=1 Tax=Pleionea sediminis TaxID=2569479 RepID=UPI0011872190|nr:UDP-N-acetylglucosamine 2-epimerase [Pleionea sediminis]